MSLEAAGRAGLPPSQYHNFISQPIDTVADGLRLDMFIKPLVTGLQNNATLFLPEPPDTQDAAAELGSQWKTPTLVFLSDF